MAKFLPFVVEKSTPIHIFQTLITRSKGMNEVLVASILYLVIEKGITQVRETASKLPEMDLDKLYETLMTQYPSYRITNEQFSKMQLISEHVEMWYPDKISAELKEYSLSDKMSFLLVMLLIGKLEDYTALHFDLLYTDVSETVLHNLVGIKLFSNEGEDYYFKSKDDLKAFIWCHELLNPEEEKLLNPVCAVYYPMEEGKKRKPNAKYGKEVPGSFSQEATEQYKKAREWDKAPEGIPPIPQYEEPKTPQEPAKSRKRRRKKFPAEPRQAPGYDLPEFPNET